MKPLASVSCAQWAKISFLDWFGPENVMAEPWVLGYTRTMLCTLTVIQANGMPGFVNGLRSGGLLNCVSR